MHLPFTPFPTRNLAKIAKKIVFLTKFAKIWFASSLKTAFSPRPGHFKHAVGPPLRPINWGEFARWRVTRHSKIQHVSR
jgi:hypothetical protein